MNVEEWLLTSLNDVHRGVAADIGANVGEWTRFLAGQFNSVVAYEPDPRAYEVLSKSLPSNARAVNAAVCDVDEPVTLRMRPSAEQSSLLADHPVGASGGTEAPVIEEKIVIGCTVDKAFPDGCDFVKIDVEGAEVAVLRAASPGRWQRATFLVECHDTFPEVLEQLHRLRKKVELIPHPYPNAAHPGHCWAIGRPLSL